MMVGAVLIVKGMAPMIGQEVRFPFPAVPDLIQDPQERMTYLLEHFWDNYNFKDTSQRNTDVAEQGFADFVYLMQRADSATAALGAQMLARRVDKDASRTKLVASLVDHYLGNPNSPLRDDVVYAHLLRALPQTPQLAYRLKQVEKNQPGMVAADFVYVDRRGWCSTLHDLASGARWTLIVFNDPECEHCHEQMPRIIASQVLAQTKGLTVLAVSPDDNTAAWHDQPLTMTGGKLQLPANWIDAYSPDGIIMRRQIYHLPAMPSLYLLDKDKRVVLKDATIEAVEQFLGQ